MSSYHVLRNNKIAYLSVLILQNDNHCFPLHDSHVSQKAVCKSRSLNTDTCLAVPTVNENLFIKDFGLSEEFKCAFCRHFLVIVALWQPIFMRVPYLEKMPLQTSALKSRFILDQMHLSLVTYESVQRVR